MTADEITKKLNSRYNWETKMSLAEDLSQMLKKYSADELSRIWARFDATYTSNVAPKPAHFYGIASDLGLLSANQAKLQQGAWVCECGKHYGPLTVYLCPACESRVVKGVGDCAHPSYQEINEESRWYKEALNRMLERSKQNADANIQSR